MYNILIIDPQFLHNPCAREEKQFNVVEEAYFCVRRARRLLLAAGPRGHLIFLEDAASG